MPLTPITEAPPVPDSNVEEGDFDDLYENFNRWQAEELVPGLNANLPLIDAAAQAAAEAALAAGVQAGLAAESATNADAAAAQAAQSEAALASLKQLWLGALASDPEVGQDGAPLVAGNAYVNTTSGYLRAYNGVAWVQGVGAVAGVSSVNGQVGAVTVQTDLFFFTQGIF